MRFFPFILRNALRSKRRTILTVLSIVVSMFLYCTIRTVITSFDASLETADAARLITRRSTSLTFFLPLSYKDRLAQIPGVSAVAYGVWFGGIYIDERNFFAQYAIDADEYVPMYSEYLITPEEREAFRRERTACIIGEKLVEKYGFKTGDAITLRGTIFPGNWDLTVRGIARPRTKNLDTNFLLMRWDLVNERMGRFNQVGWYVVKLSDPARAGEVARTIDRAFANSPAETKTETEKAFQLGFLSMLGNIRAVVFAIGSAIVIAILLVSMNTMMMAARERTREVAVLKALGFTDRTVLGMILAESLLISLTGGVLGAGIARVVYDASGFTAGGFFPSFFVTGGTIARALGIAAAMGLLSGAIPAADAFRLRVVDALRHAG
ncbi:MAG: ABC transporter permease [Candidatus Eisenbacteria bacterium]|nr:ABC transporter permease [Candidatus Eisenbacteria bacterium]